MNFLYAIIKSMILVWVFIYIYIGESFEDYSWIQDFVTGWLSIESQPQNAELGRL